MTTRKQFSSAAPLYQGHEVACHSLTHLYMEHLSEEELMAELQTDKSNLERLFGREIKGFAVPFDYYSGLIEHCARKCGYASCFTKYNMDVVFDRFVYRLRLAP